MTTDPSRPAPPRPTIDLPPALAIPTAAAPVLAALFAGYARVVVEGEFGGGFSGARVLKVLPYRDAETPELPTVVKVGPAELIRQEYAAYRRFIRGRLSGIPEVWGEPVYGVGGVGSLDQVDAVDPVDGVDTVDRADEAERELGELGGLRYALVGAGLFEFVSLARYAETAAPEDLAQVLESRVFVHLGTIWRQARLSAAGAPLGAAYLDFLEPDRGAFFAAALGGTRLGSGGSRTMGTGVGGAPDLSARTVSPSGRPDLALPNPLTALPEQVRGPIPHRVATIHGDLNLENVLVDPAARTVRLIDFSHSREDHVLHDLLRLETGLITRTLPSKLAEVGLGPEAVVDLYRQLHLAADAEPPDPALRSVYIGLIATRKAAIPLLADPADWREYLVGLAAYLVGAGKYRNLQPGAKAVAFWAAAAALDLAETSPAANLDALERAIPVLLDRNPVLEAYRRGRIAEWAGPRYELDERFVELSLLVDQGEESAGGRWQAKEKRYGALGDLLAEVPDPALVVLGAPGSGKSTLLRRLELELALAGLDAPDAPLSFFQPLGQYKPARPGDPPPSPRAWLAAQWSARHPKLPPLEELLAEGRMILLLDALNEIPAVGAADARARVGAWKDFAQEVAAGAAGNRVLFSCRSLDYSTPLSTPALRVPQVQVEPLGDAQVQRFLGQYVPERAEELWLTLAGSGHLDVVRSPYFLRLLVEQVEASGEVPLGRAALFTGFVRRAMVREVERDHPLFLPDGLLTERDVRRLTVAREWRTPYELPERGVLVPKLSELAYRMQERSEAEGEAAQVRVGYETALDLLGHARDADIVAAGAALGVLDEDPGQDQVLYVHQLVQEYFAARELARDAVGANSRAPQLVAAEWRAVRIRPSVRELIEALPPAEELPALPRTGWEETALLAAAMTADEGVEAYVQGLMAANLALAGRCANLPEVRGRVGEAPLDELRWALVHRSRDPEADLRDRIACGLAVGELGDPRFERRVGPYGEYLMPPLVEIAGGVYPIGEDKPFDWADSETRGTDAKSAEMPRHSVEISPLAIARFPVTNAEWRCFMDAGGYEVERLWDTDDARAWQRGELANEGAKANNRYWREKFLENLDLFERMVDEGRLTSDKHVLRWRVWLELDDEAFEAALASQWQATRATEPGFWQDQRFNAASQPVVGVCWYEARAYCKWLGAQTGLAFRLPTEVEWEAATRGSLGRPYAYGDVFDAMKGNTVETRVKQPTPVGVFVEGDTPEGVSDMAGSVEHWTSSVWGGTDDYIPQYAYPYDPNDGREDPNAGSDHPRVLRGGSWRGFHGFARATPRSHFRPNIRYNGVGFRVFVEVPASRNTPIGGRISARIAA